MGELTLQQKLSTAEALILVLKQENANLKRDMAAQGAGFITERAAFNGEKAAMEAKIKDLQEALDICNGKHGGNWGGKPIIPGRMG
jgi:hypothetical protein